MVLLHGYAENSDEGPYCCGAGPPRHWALLQACRRYDKKTQAKDIRAVVTSLGYDKTSVVAHDIGNMVAYAYAAIYPDKLSGWLFGHTDPGD